MDVRRVLKQRTTPVRSHPSILNTPHRDQLSVSKVKAVTPGDRFIPNRRSTKLDEAHFRVTRTAPRSSMSDQERCQSQTLVTSPLAVTFSPTKTFDEALNSIRRRRLAFLVDDEEPGAEKETSLKGVDKGRRVLSFVGSQSRMQSKAAIFSTVSQQCESASLQRICSRSIPSTARRILDLPAISNDFYSTMMDWGSANEIVVALDDQVFKWNASTCKCTRIESRRNLLVTSPLTVTAVAWDPASKYLAIGFSRGHLELWNNVKESLDEFSLNYACEHAGSIYGLAWNGVNSLFSVSRCGCITHYDMEYRRVESFATSPETELRCALAVSGDGQHLAAAGNTGLINVYTINDRKCMRVIQAHCDTIKALSWCPWQPKVLASAAGISDGRICLWKNNNGALLSHVDTKSQVCCMVWAPKFQELITGHGVTYFDIIIWKYPNLEPVGRLRGHEFRVLGLVLSPCDGVLDCLPCCYLLLSAASCGADELLMLWDCFVSSPTTSSAMTSRDRRSAGAFYSANRSPFVSSIR